MSNINASGIAADYPRAGQDNDSQGFRDNFTNIKQGLTTAGTEITDLQNKVLLKSALTGGSLDNNLGGNTIRNGVFKQLNPQYYPATNNSGASAVTISLDNGPVQKAVLNANASITLTGWPVSGVHGSLKLILSSDQLGAWYPTFLTATGGSPTFEVGFPTNPATSTPGFLVGGEGVASVTISGTWSGFTANTTTVTFSAPAQGVRATGTAIIDGGGNVTGVTITNPGSGYTSAPSCTIVDSDVGSEVTGSSVSVLTTNTKDNIKVVEAWSIDAGSTVYIRYLGEY